MHEASMPRTLSIVPEMRTGCYLWRSVWPSNALTNHGHVADRVLFDHYRENVRPRMLSGDYNVVLTPRCAWKERYMQPVFDNALQTASLAWVYELDDDLFSDDIIERYYQYNVASKRGEEFDYEERRVRLTWAAQHEREARARILPLVDLCIVTSERLVPLVRQHTDCPIRVVPNAIDVPWFTQRLHLNEPRNVQGLTVGWSGGWRPEDDTAVLEAVWPRLAKRYPHVKFILAGWAPPSLVAAMPADQLVVLEWEDLESYPYAIRNIDIACCVVADHAWNRCKTPIKWIESSMAGSAVVASPTLYSEVITDDVDGLLANTAEEWEECLSVLIENTDYRHYIQQTAAQNVTTKHTTEQTWELWRDALAEGLRVSERAQGVVLA